MITIPFVPIPNKSPPFQTLATLDGKNYQITATWSFFAQRWYLTITNNSGASIWAGAMVGSPTGFNIYLALGIFQTSTLLFRADTGNIEIGP